MASFSPVTHGFMRGHITNVATALSLSFTEPDADFSSRFYACTVCFQPRVQIICASLELIVSVHPTPSCEIEKRYSLSCAPGTVALVNSDGASMCRISFAIYLILVSPVAEILLTVVSVAAFFAYNSIV